MGSIGVSSEDDELEQLSERLDSYSLSADVSESESSGGFSCRQYGRQAPAASASLTSSPPSGPDFADIFYSQQPPMPFVLPAVGGRRVVLAPTMTEKPQTKLSG